MKRRRSDKGKAKRQRGRLAQGKHLRALERLESERTLFEPATRRVVHAALERAGLDGSDDSPVIEIGSGGGQLRRWLPEGLLPAMVHTERDPAFVRKFQQAAPEAAVQTAPAESLPYAEQSVAGVLGLCVLDIVDLEIVAKELYRVLKPRGCIVQFWDLAANMTWLCEQAMRQACVLLPDCFSDPIVRAELPAELQGVLPPLDFLQDLIRVPLGQLESLIRLLRPQPSKLIDSSALDRLARYAQLFAAQQPDARAPEQPSDRGSASAAANAARALAWLSADEREAYACKRLLINAWTMLQQARGGTKLPLELERLSSAEALSERLTRVFTALGMDVDCGVQRARALAERPAEKGPASERLRHARFAGRWLGTNAFAAAIPPAAADVLGADEVPAQGQLVVEAGVLVLLARRPGEPEIPGG